MARTKAPVPTPEWVKPRDKQKRELQGKHEGSKNGHAKPKPRVKVGTAAAKALGIE